MTAFAAAGGRVRPGCAALLALVALGAAGPAAAQATVHPTLWPEGDPTILVRPETEATVTRLLGRMSLEEKVGQLIQADISTITPDDLRRYPLGAVLAGGNSGPGGDDRAPTERWLALVDAFHRVALEARPGHTPVPVLFGIDAVHGHNNLIGATLFPHNIGLGAARDPELIRRIGQATAAEVAATHIDWAFAPTLAVARDLRWGRHYESYGERPDPVRDYAGAMVEGLQGRLGAPDFLRPPHVIASVKHFLGDGGTLDGRDQGDNRASEADLIRLDDAGYPPAIAAGAATVMASFSSWQGTKMVADAGLLTDVLKGRMGFGGFVVGDWNAHAQVPGCTKSDCPAAFDAGLDMVMAADGWRQMYESTLAEARSGTIPAARLDDAVRRILRVKVLAGLLDPARPGAPPITELGSAAHRALAREAVRKSLVLLKNEGGLLPLRADAKVLVAGDGADSIAKQCGGWTISWQGTGNRNGDFPGGTSIFAGLKAALAAGGGSARLSPDGSFIDKPDAAIVVFGEDPYAEFQGDLDTVEYQPGDKRDLALLRRLKARGIPTVAVFLSGRPLWVNPELNASDAFVAAWLPGTEGEGVADLLVRRPDGGIAFDFTGRLAFSWPATAAQASPQLGQGKDGPLFPYGYGLRDGDHVAVPVLSEASAAPAGVRRNLERYFADGRVLPPWSFALGDTAGERRVARFPETSPAGTVALRSIDVAKQEDAEAVRWSGAGRGVLAVAGSPVDLGRQANGDMALLLKLRVDRAPDGPVGLAMGCGPSCRGRVEIGGLLRAMPPDAWRTLKIKLSCFAAAGAEMGGIDRPVVLETAGRLALSLETLALVENTGDATCPLE